MRSAKTDQTAQMYRLICVFTGNTILIVGFFYAHTPVNVIYIFIIFLLKKCE